MRQTIYWASKSGGRRGGGGCATSFFSLFLLFTAIPLVELYLLVVLGRRVGLLPTIGLVLATGALGAFLARTQGLQTLDRIRAELDAGRMPAAALLDGLLILVAGAVLLTPGLLTDVFGFSLLLPATRKAVRRTLGGWLKKRFVPTSPMRRDDEGEVIFVEKEEDDRKNRGSEVIEPEIVDD